MSKKEYTSRVTTHSPRPRSKRARFSGSSVGSASVIASSTQQQSVTFQGHSHANKTFLDQIFTDNNGYQYLNQIREIVDESGNTSTTRVSEKVKAGYADYAHDLSEDSPARNQFLSKIADDVASGKITFLQGIALGSYLEGASGASIDEDGNAEVESISVRSFLRVFELIYNRINAVDGATSFSDAATIESAVYTNGGQILSLRRRWSGDVTTFQPGDIIYGYVNDLDSVNNGSAYKSWAWIKSVNREDNTIFVIEYDGSDVPSGINFPMAPTMVITRWGNNIEPSEITFGNKEYASFIKKSDTGYVNTRQNTFFISSEDGNLLELTGVNSPKIAPSNYGTVLGKIPEGLLSKETEKLVNFEQPYLYARGIIVQDLIRVDYNGVVARTANYRGTWAQDTAESDGYHASSSSYDTVTWNGCLWQCIANGTTDEPSDETGSWVNMSGGVIPKLSVWKILPNADTISIRNTENGVDVFPQKVTCSVLLTDSEIGTKTYTSSADLREEEGVSLYYSLDGESWKEFVIGSTESLELEDETPIELESSTESNPQYLILGGDDVDSSLVGDRVYFELRNDTDVLERAIIPIIKDGFDGKDGMMVYPAGNYDASTLYATTDNTSPVVQYEGNYYMLIRGKSYKGTLFPQNRNTPASDVANGGADTRWKLFDKFSAVFADVIMADFAKLGMAVFYGDYMISQNGTINGAESSAYNQFTDGKTHGTFIPYLMLNFKTGEISSEKGSIGGFSISGDHLGIGESDTQSKGMSLYQSGIRFQSQQSTQFAAVGSNVLPLSIGNPAVAHFVNRRTDPIDSNWGIIVEVENGRFNLAMRGKGNVSMDGIVTGHNLSSITTLERTVSYMAYNASTILVTCNTSDSHIVLPAKQDVQGQLGLGLSTPFSVRLTIIAGTGCSKTFYVEGRNTTITDASGSAFLDIADLPYRLNTSGEQKLTNGLDMKKGDVVEYQLVYDGTTYNAYLLQNKQA